MDFGYIEPGANVKLEHLFDTTLPCPCSLQHNNDTTHQTKTNTFSPTNKGWLGSNWGVYLILTKVSNSATSFFDTYYIQPQFQSWWIIINGQCAKNSCIDSHIILLHVTSLTLLHERMQSTSVYIGDMGDQPVV